MPLQVHKEKCPHCDRVIEGLSKRSVEWNMELHIKSKHEEELKEEKKK